MTVLLAPYDPLGLARFAHHHLWISIAGTINTLTPIATPHIHGSTGLVAKMSCRKGTYMAVK